MLKFVGDVCLSDIYLDVGCGIGTNIANGGRPFNNIPKSADDIWIGNFESVAATNSVHKNYHKDFFRIEPDLLNNCQFIDYYGVANNHVMEHGPEAYKEMCHTLTNVCKGIFGSNEQKSISFDHQGKHVSITGFSLRCEENGYTPLYWNMPDCSDIEKEYQNLKSDYKIAYIHWGVEFITYPNFEQRRFAHWLIDLGFDLIIGMHPHVLQGYEKYKEKYIFYSLGNFVFNMAWEPTKYSIVVNVDLLNNKTTYEYVKIDKYIAPRIVNEKEVPEYLRIQTLNKNIGVIQNLEEYIAGANKGLKLYRKSAHKAFIKNLSKFNKGIIKEMIFDFIKRRVKRWK